MCYYDHIVFTCGDWKWGGFKARCVKERRIGRTCGSKFIYHTVPHSSKCSICLALDRKYRRYAKAKADYERWIVDPGRQASAGEADERCKEVAREIQELKDKRQACYSSLGRNGVSKTLYPRQSQQRAEAS